MTTYAVFATRFDSTAIVEELIPARGLSFSMPLSDDGEASFTATVEPGRSLWRAAIGLPFSGILIARDGVPVWQGRVNGERQSGPRTFQFTAREWGSWFADCDAPQADYLLTDSHAAFRDLITKAQATPGKDVKITLPPASTGGVVAGQQVNSWDSKSVDDVYKAIADADGGPEWYFGTGGTLANPVRALSLGNRLGSVSAVDVLHYVESTVDWKPTAKDGGVMLLSCVWPIGSAPMVEDLPRRGGNVLAVARDRDVSRSATRVIATGNGDQGAQLRATATATKLLAQGWPLITKYTQHAVDDMATLQRLANADLASMSGISTRYSLSTFDGDPDWTMVPRGSTMRVLLDTDVYAIDRPYSFESRLLNLTVNVDDNGPAQIDWQLSEVMEAR